MSEPGSFTPMDPDTSPDATLRLKAMSPADPDRTQKLLLPPIPEAEGTVKLPLSELGGDPADTLKIPRPQTEIPPVQREQPVEAAGQTQKLSVTGPASASGRWKLPLVVGGAVVIAAAGYLLIVRRPGAAPTGASMAGEPVPPQPGSEPVPAAARAYLAQAEAGDAHAMRMLGAMYYYGLNVPKDRERGLHWYRKAVEKGSDAAREELSRIEGGR